ncbi:MAG: GTPase [Desulfurococcaceae archaeon]
MKDKLMTSVFHKIYIKSYDELYQYVNIKMRKHIVPGGNHSLYKVLKSKLSLTYDIIVDELKKIISALSLISSSDFYRELYKAYTGEEPLWLINRIRVSLRIADKIYKDSISKMNSSKRLGDSELIVVFKEGVGRLLSIYRRLSSKISVLKEFLKEISRMPGISGEYVVVIAGMPQVGKSTLLSKLTSAKPVIGTYPFTTKTLIAGHIDLGPCGKIVIIDSPGLLDSPLEEKNIIEYKAILAVKFIADHLLYLFEPTPFFYYSIDEQLNVYISLKTIIGDKPVTLAINKVDLVDLNALERVMDIIERRTGIKPIPISAMTGYNLDLLRENIVDIFRRRNRCL